MNFYGGCFPSGWPCPTPLFKAGKWYTQNLQSIWKVEGGHDPSKTVILNQGCFCSSLGLPRCHSGKKIHLPMQEIWVETMGQEDPLEEEMAMHSSILAWKSHGQRSLVGYSPGSCREWDMTEWLGTQAPTRRHLEMEMSGETDDSGI